MGFYNSPRIITDNLVLSLDAANVKSWSGVDETTGGSPYGYFTGGVKSGSPYDTSASQRIDFSSDSSTTSPKGPLTENKRMHSGTGSNSYGYLAGQLPNNTNADRIDYSNDTATALSRSDVLVDEANRRAAVGNNSYGYFAGGTPSTTKVSRLDYSNDTGGGAQKGYLSTGRYGLSGTGNSSYGYMAGAFSPANVDRIDYSSDTSTTLTRGPLTSSRYGVAAMGNANYGYWAGGYPENTLGTTIDRLDYASDTDTCLSKGNLSESKYWVTGTGSPTYGYIGGGREQHDPGQSDFSWTSKIERIDYSNDTATASPKGPLAIAVRETGAVSSQANGLGPSSSSTWKDMTGSGNNIDVDGPTFSGLNGGVWDFNGSSNYMEKTTFSDVAFGTGDFAVETWVRVDNLTANHMIFESRSDVGATQDGFVFFVYGSNQDEWAVWTAGAAKISGANGSVAADTWYHTIVTRISGTTTLYVNGVSIGSFSDSYNYSNDDLRIGKNVSSADYLNGKIALFKIYKAKGFTEAEALQNFNATRTRFGV